jgi:hypothetical protein
MMRMSAGQPSSRSSFVPFGADRVAQQAGQFGDVGVVAGIAVGVLGRFPRSLRDATDRGPGVQVEPDAVVDPVPTAGVQRGDVADDLLAGAGDGDQQVPPIGRGI